MVNVRQLKCILFVVVTGFFLSVYFISLIPVCCDISQEVKTEDNCVVCNINEPEHVPVAVNVDPPMPTSKNVTADPSYLRFFNDKSFQKIEKICPSSRKGCDEGGACVPVNLQV